MNLPIFRWQYCYFLFMVWMLASCASSSKSPSSGQDPSSEIVDQGYQRVQAKNSNQSNIQVNPNEERAANLSLEEMLQRLPGVRLKSGRGPSSQFIVSGSSMSFMADTRPLFVVNGRVMGNDFSIVHALVYPNDVTSLNVLKGSDASIYGTRGANGVILIRTK